jgi:hypothetical protein
VHDVPLGEHDAALDPHGVQTSRKYGLNRARRTDPYFVVPIENGYS